MLKKLLSITVITVLVTTVAFSKSYQFDCEDPVSVVSAAAEMLVNDDYQSMIEITEGSEKRKTQEALDYMQKDHRLIQRIKEDSKLIESYEILQGEFYQTQGYEVAVVSTKWKIKVTPTIQKNAPSITMSDIKAIKRFSVVYVDYMLKNFDGKWKIISRRAL